MTGEKEAQSPARMDANATEVDKLTQEILGDRHLGLQIEGLQLDEKFDGRVANADATIVQRSGEEERKVVVAGQGVGLVDAFFDGVMKVYAKEHPSLNTVSVTDFAVRSGFEGAVGRKSDAEAEAVLKVINSEEAQFEFIHRSNSVSHSSLQVVLNMASFFINSERAYVQLHLALKDAKERRRSDLVERFKREMAILVKATSYSEVVQRLREESGE